jgi:hypothetical protein
MAYVDLNPVRAEIADTPEESEFTSIYARVRQHASFARQRPSKHHQLRVHQKIPPLMAFNQPNTDRHLTLPMRFNDYLQLLDWTGRTRRTGKRGAIAKDTPPILMRLQIDPDMWHHTMRPSGNAFGRALGRVERLQSHAKRLGQSWIKGIQMAQRLYCRA